MAFPTSPTDGQEYGDFEYNDIIGAWVASSGGVKEQGSNNNGDWIKLDNDLILQWCTKGCGTDGAHTQDIWTFPISFTTSAKVIGSIGIGSTTSSSYYTSYETLSVYIPTLSSVAYVYHLFGNTTWNRQASFLAIGY